MILEVEFSTGTAADGKTVGASKADLPWVQREASAGEKERGEEPEHGAEVCVSGRLSLGLMAWEGGGGRVVVEDRIVQF